MNNNDAIDTLREIKDLMQKSSRFQTISGISIIIIGIYASIVSFGAWLLLGNHEPYSWLPSWATDFALNTPGRTWAAILCALVLLVLSFGTVCLMSYFKTKRVNQRFVFDQTVRRSLWAFFVPAATGGLLCLAMLQQGHYGITSSFMLVFYGLALINSAHHTTSRLALLGYVELLLGIVDCFVVNQGLLFWFLGFGLWHIIFGIFFTLSNRRQS
ncbi:MAG: hypothetical protein IJ785_08460 [Bacteroidales bacterium]|nr:hypothetical protein [Bacteroidales bacterium]